MRQSHLKYSGTFCQVNNWKKGFLPGLFSSGGPSLRFLTWYDGEVSPRLAQLADIFHMMMGGDPASAIQEAGPLLAHCHIADYATRQFPGFDPAVTDRLRPYFAALKAIGYTGGVSCECSWGEANDFARNAATALETMKSLAI